MTKEKLLTVRWNNILAFVLGLPILIYVIVILSMPDMPNRAAFIALLLMGVVY